MKFQKKPVTIDAFVLERSDWPLWFKRAIDAGIVEIFLDGHAEILTLEGKMRAEHDSYIIRGVHKELYPCKREIFEETYTRVD